MRRTMTKVTAAPAASEEKWVESTPWMWSPLSKIFSSWWSSSLQLWGKTEQGNQPREQYVCLKNGHHATSVCFQTSITVLLLIVIISIIIISSSSSSSYSYTCKPVRKTKPRLQAKPMQEPTMGPDAAFCCEISEILFQRYISLWLLLSYYPGSPDLVISFQLLSSVFLAIPFFLEAWLDVGGPSQGPQPLLWYTIQLGNLTRVGPDLNFQPSWRIRLPIKIWFDSNAQLPTATDNQFNRAWKNQLLETLKAVDPDTGR